MNRTVMILSTAGLLVLLALAAAPAKKHFSPPPATATAAPTAPIQLPVTHTNLGALPRVELPGVTAESGPLGLAAQLPGQYAANGDAPTYVMVDVAAKALEHEPSERQPVNLALVIDRSCSMSGEKIARAKDAARALIQQLRPTDRLALVAYGSDVVTRPSSPVDTRARAQLLEWVDALQAVGSTNISWGLTAGEAEVQRFSGEYRASRVILVSDGQPTDGITSREGLEERVRAMRERGVTVTALGVGADFDEVLMRGIAESGAGFYGYIEDASRLAEVFSAELQQASRLVARNVVLTFEPAAGVQLEEVLGKPMVTTAAGAGARLYDFSAGLSSRTVMRLSVSRPATETPAELGRFHLTYTDVETGRTVRADAVVQAKVTSDAPLALQNADPEILQHAARAERAKQVQLAAVQLRAGNEAEAQRTLDFGLDNLRKVFGSSADALAGETRIDRNRSASDNAKQFESKSMKSFGSNNTY